MFVLKISGIQKYIFFFYNKMYLKLEIKEGTQLSLTGNSLKKMSKMSSHFFWVK